MTNLQQTLVQVKHGLVSAPELLQSEDTHMANLTYQQGVRAFNAKDYITALDFFTVAVIQLPFNATYSFALAMTYHALNEEQEAISFYIRSWLFDATNPATCFRLGQCYLTLKEYADAVESVETAIKLAELAPEHQEILMLSRQLLVEVKARNT